MDLPISTERLVLRALTLDDIDAYLAMVGNPDVMRYLYEEVMDREAALADMEKRMGTGRPEEGEWRNVAVDLDGEFLGQVGVCLRSVVHRQCEVGYAFRAEAQGHGYATEATAVMIDYAFLELNAHRVCGRLDARNEASARVLQRLGMRFEGHLRENEFVKGEWTDEAIYAITEDEWRASRSG